MAGPLDGVKIIELSEIIAAPFGGMMLADMGADVIKVEPPWGEPWRTYQQFVPMESRVFMAVNRGKRSLALDLGRPEARAIVYELLPGMDVVIVNYRPDVPEKLGVDYETLSAINPRLIYCENSAFGSAGPKGRLPGYDMIVQAMSGLMAAEGKMAGGSPQHLFTSVVDVSTGLAMAWAVCAALYARERTGRGQKIESTLLATALAMQGSRFLSVEASDAEPQREMLEEMAVLREQGLAYPELQARYQAFHEPPKGNIYYRAYTTKDGALAVGCLSDPLRKKLLDVLGLHDAQFEPGYDPYSDAARSSGEELTARAEELFQRKTTSEWVAILEDAGVPVHPVMFTEELLADDQVLANDMAVELEHSLAGKLKMVGPLVKMSDTPLSAESASPALGRHTDEILGGLGYCSEHIRRLRESGMVR